MKIIGGGGGVGAEDAAPGIIFFFFYLPRRTVDMFWFSGLMAMEMCAKDLFELTIRFWVFFSKKMTSELRELVFNSINALWGAATNEWTTRWATLQWTKWRKVAVACRRRGIKKERKRKKKGLRDTITFWRLNKLARYKHGIIIHTAGICSAAPAGLWTGFSGMK